MYNDKMLENINTKIEGLTSYINNQMSFNKMIETQIAQLATTIPVSSRRILGQPEASLESIKMVSTRSDKPLCWENHDYLVDPPFIAKKEDPKAPDNHMLNWPACLPQRLLRPWRKHQHHVQGNI